MQFKESVEDGHNLESSAINLRNKAPLHFVTPSSDVHDPESHGPKTDSEDGEEDYIKM